MFKHVYFEDFEVGDRFTYGQHQVSEEQIVAFARQFDPQPFHADPQRATGTVFGGLIASGFHTLSLWARMAVDAFPDIVSMGSSGFDEIRWPHPVRPSDTLTVQSEVVESRPSRSRPEMGILKFRNTVVNQRGDPVLTMLQTWFVGRRR